MFSWCRAKGKLPVTRSKTLPRHRLFTFERSGTLTKELVAEFQALNQCIHLRLCVIHGKAGAAGGADGEVIHERLRAVMPGAYGDAHFVQYR